MAKTSRNRPKSRPPMKATRPLRAGKAVRPGKSSSRPGKTSGKPVWVYTFGDGKAQGRADMRNLLGGKGAGLAEMASLGLPVPPGFTITTEVCRYFYAHGKTYP